MGDRDNIIKFGPEWLRNMATRRRQVLTGGLLANNRGGHRGGGQANRNGNGAGGRELIGPGRSTPSTIAVSSTSSASTVVTSVIATIASTVATMAANATTLASNNNTPPALANRVQTNSRLNLAKLRYGREEMLGLYESNNISEPTSELKNFELIYDPRGKPPIALNNTFEDERESVRSVPMQGPPPIPYGHRMSSDRGRGRGVNAPMPSMMRQYNSRWWRRQASGREDLDYSGEWRAEARNQRNSFPQDKWERDRGDRTNRGKPHPWNNRKRSDHSEDGNYPEWALESDIKTQAGSFDSMGAFHGNDDTNVPRTPVEQYASADPHRQNTFLSTPRPIEEGSEEWWSSEKAQKLSPKRFQGPLAKNLKYLAGVSSIKQQKYAKAHELQNVDASDRQESDDETLGAGAMDTGALGVRDNSAMNICDMGTTDMGVSAMDSGPVGSAAMNAAPMGSPAMGSLSMSPAVTVAKALGVSPVVSSAMDVGPMVSSAAGAGALSAAKVVKSLAASPMGSAAMGGGPMNPATMVAKTLGSPSAMDSGPMGSSAMGASPMGSSAMGTGPISSSATSTRPMGSMAMSVGPMGSSAMGARPMGSAVMSAVPMGSSAKNPAAMGSSAMGASPMSSAAMRAGPKGSAAMGASLMSSAAMGVGPMGSTAMGAGPMSSASMGAGPMGSAAMGAGPMSSASMGAGPMGSAAMGAGPMSSASMGAGPMGSAAMGAGPMGSAAMGAGPMGSAAMGAGPMGSAAMGAGPMGSAAMGASLMGSASMGAGSMGSAAMGAGPMGSAAMGASLMGSASMGAGSMGSSAMGASQMGFSSMGAGSMDSSSMGSGPLGFSGMGTGQMGSSAMVAGQMGSPGIGGPLGFSGMGATPMDSSSMGAGTMATGGRGVDTMTTGEMSTGSVNTGAVKKIPQMMSYHKFMQNKTFDTLMRTAIHPEETIDETGNFNSVMIAANNSLREKHQNFVPPSEMFPSSVIPPTLQEVQQEAHAQDLSNSLFNMHLNNMPMPPSQYQISPSNANYNNSHMYEMQQSVGAVRPVLGNHNYGVGLNVGPQYQTSSAQNHAANMYMPRNMQDNIHIQDNGQNMYQMHQGSETSFNMNMFSDDMSVADSWVYQDPEGKLQGPFTSKEMLDWYFAGFFEPNLLLRRTVDNTMRRLWSYSKLPFITKNKPNPVPMPPTKAHMPNEDPNNSIMNPPLISYNHQPMDSLWQHTPTSRNQRVWRPDVADNLEPTSVSEFFAWNKQSTVASNLLRQGDVHIEMKTEDEILAQMRASQNINNSQNLSYMNVEQPRLLSQSVNMGNIDEAVGNNMHMQVTPNLEELEKFMHRDSIVTNIGGEVNPERLTFGKHQQVTETSSTIAAHTEQSDVTNGGNKNVQSKNLSDLKQNKPKNESADKAKIKDGVSKNKKNKAKEEKKEESQDSKSKEDIVKTEKKSVEEESPRNKKEDKINKKELEKDKKELRAKVLENNKRADDLKMQEMKKRYMEKLASDNEKKRKDVQIQEIRAQNDAATKAAWSVCYPDTPAVNMRGPSFAEIQRLEREKKMEELKEQQQMMQIIAEQQQFALTREQDMQSGLAWSRNKGVPYNYIGQSLNEIQAETRRQVAGNNAATMAMTDEKPTPINQYPPSIRWNSPPNRMGFWDLASLENSDQITPNVVESPPANERQTKTSTPLVKQRQPKSPKVEFEEWCTTALASWSAKVDVPTFIAFLMDIESPYEVKDYVNVYLGETKEASEFSRTFLEKRSKMLRTGMVAPADDLASPAAAINPRSNNCSGDSQDFKGNKNKKSKKKGMTRIDASSLGFSVTAAEDRINVGDIDKL